MYNTMRFYFYWPFMSGDAYAYVRNCVSCAKTKGTGNIKSRLLQLFPADGPFEFVAMDILVPYR